MCSRLAHWKTDFWATLLLPTKTEFAMKFFTVLNIHFTFRTLSNLRLTWKTVCALSSLNWIYFVSFSIFEQLALSLKNSVALKFSLCWNNFCCSGFCATCACPENRVCPEIFHCTEHALYTPYFWATFACLKTRVCPEITALNIYLLSFRNFEELALALKNRVCLEDFHCIEIFMIIQDFWATFAFLETSCRLHWNFSSRRGCPPPASHAHDLEYMGILSGRPNAHLSPW